MLDNRVWRWSAVVAYSVSNFIPVFYGVILTI